MSNTLDLSLKGAFFNFRSPLALDCTVRMFRVLLDFNYRDVIMSAMASQITHLSFI